MRAAAKTHISTAVIGTRGGVGASTMATSLAWLFSADNKLPTALLDLDIHFGTGALALDLEPGRGLTDAIENPSRIDGLFIERAMIRANDNLAILSAEAPINSPLMTDGSAFVQLEEEFRQAFEMTVIDLPRNMLINFPHLLTDVNVVVLATELTLASARDAIRLLSWLKTNAAHAQVHRRGQQGPAGRRRDQQGRFRSLDRAQDQLHRALSTQGRGQRRQAGPDLCRSQPHRARPAAAIRDIAKAVMGATDSRRHATRSKPAKKSLLGKLDLKSMLPKKAKAGRRQLHRPNKPMTAPDGRGWPAPQWWNRKAKQRR